MVRGRAALALSVLVAGCRLSPTEPPQDRLSRWTERLADPTTRAKALAVIAEDTEVVARETSGDVTAGPMREIAERTVGPLSRMVASPEVSASDRATALRLLFVTGSPTARATVVAVVDRCAAEGCTRDVLDGASRYLLRDPEGHDEHRLFLAFRASGAPWWSQPFGPWVLEHEPEDAWMPDVARALPDDARLRESFLARPTAEKVARVLASVTSWSDHAPFEAVAATGRVAAGPLRALSERAVGFRPGAREEALEQAAWALLRIGDPGGAAVAETAFSVASSPESRLAAALLGIGASPTPTSRRALLQVFDAFGPEDGPPVMLASCPGQGDTTTARAALARRMEALLDPALADEMLTRLPRIAAPPAQRASRPADVDGSPGAPSPVAVTRDAMVLLASRSMGAGDVGRVLQAAKAFGSLGVRARVTTEAAVVARCRVEAQCYLRAGLSGEAGHEKAIAMLGLLEATDTAAELAAHVDALPIPALRVALAVLVRLAPKGDAALAELLEAAAARRTKREPDAGRACGFATAADEIAETADVLRARTGARTPARPRGVDAAR